MSGTIAVDALTSLELHAPGAEAAAVYDSPIALRALHTDSRTGAEHYLVRYPADVRCRRHRHTAAHTIVVLDGRLDADGTVIGPGAYAHFPAGVPMTHQPAGDAPCTFVLIFDGPFDVELVDH